MLRCLISIKNYIRTTIALSVGTNRLNIYFFGGEYSINVCIHDVDWNKSECELSVAWILE